MTNKNKLYVVDTNVLLNNKEFTESYSVVLLSHVLHELESHSISTHRELAYNSRIVTRYIKNNKDRFTFDTKSYIGSELGEGYSASYQDDNILKACLDNGYGLITEDVLLQMKSEGLGIETIDPMEYEVDNPSHTDTNYNGIKEVVMTDKELQEVYNNLEDNKWNLLRNQYLVVIDSKTNEDVDCLKWNGESLQRSREKGFKTDFFGSFKPYDFYQKAAIDSIMHNDITMLTGIAGTGKSLIALNTAWHLIERGIYDRLIIFTNPVKTKNAEALGFYSGDRTEKLLDSQIGIMLTSKFGDMYTVKREITEGKLQLLPFSDIRGFDTTSERKSLVWFTEAQNTDRELMKLGLERIGDNTKVIIDGDPEAQVDMDIYRTSNGMKRASEVFRGEEDYGEISLKNVYRSRIAELASKM